MPNPTIGQDDVSIQDFSGHGIGSAGADGRTHIIVEPTNEIVTDVFRVFLHVSSGRLILIANLKGIEQAYFLKGFVPHHDPLPHPSSVSNGRGVFDVKNDGVFHWADFERWVRLLHVPAIDIASAHIAVLIFTKIAVTRGEISDTLVSLARFVGGVGFDFTDGKMKGFEQTAGNRHLKSDLNVLREGSSRLDRGQLLFQSNRAGPKKLGTFSQQKGIKVNHGAPLRMHGDDRHVCQHSVGKQALNGALGFRISARTNFNVGLNQHHSFADLLPVDIHVRLLQSGILLAAGHRQGNEEFLGDIFFGESCQKLVVLGIVKEPKQTRTLINGRDDLLVALKDLGIRRIVRFFLRLSLRRMEAQSSHNSAAGKKDACNHFHSIKD